MRRLVIEQVSGLVGRYSAAVRDLSLALCKERFGNELGLSTQTLGNSNLGGLLIVPSITYNRAALKWLIFRASLNPSSSLSYK